MRRRYEQSWYRMGKYWSYVSGGVNRERLSDGEKTVRIRVDCIPSPRTIVLVKLCLAAGTSEHYKRTKHWRLYPCAISPINR